MTNTTENQTQYAERERMARTLSDAYNWDFNQLMLMSWADLYDTYQVRYLDYIYGV
jgi:hypothetical protein